MATNAVDSAIDAVVAHLATIAGIADALRGWPERNKAFTLDAGPVVTLTYTDHTRSEHPPYPVVEGPTVTWKTADLKIGAQLDLWAAYKAQADDAAGLIQAGFHDDIPLRAGLHLTQADYFGRSVSAELGRGRRTNGPLSASEGEWRRTWDVQIWCAEVVQADTPQQLETILRTGDNAGSEDTSVTP